MDEEHLNTEKKQISESPDSESISSVQDKNEKSLRLALSKLERSRLASLNLMEDLKQEIEIRKKTETDLRASESKFRSLFSGMQEGFALHEIICDDNGRAVDYRFLDINNAYGRLTGLDAEEIIGKTVLSVLPRTEPFWISKYGKVALEMKEVAFEHYSRELKRYYRVLAFSPKKGQFATLFEDVTEERKMEKRIKQNEEKFRVIFESVGSGILYMSRSGKIIDVNPAFEKITGFMKENLIGKNVQKLIRQVLSESDSKSIFRTLENTLNGKSIVSFPFELNGKYITGSTFLSKDKKMIISLLNDQTEQRKTEEERLNLFIRYKTILGAVTDILMEVDNDTVYTWANEAGIQFFGEDVLGKKAEYYFADNSDILNAVEPVFQGDDAPVYIESNQRRKDGEIRLLAWWCKSLKDSDGNVIGALSTARDITDSKKREVEIIQSREDLKQLNIYLQNVREEERKLISRELHDDLGQALTAIKIDLGSLKSNLQNRQNTELKINKIQDLLSDSIGTVKRITSQLRPHILDDLGLTSAIEWYTQEFNKRTKIKVTLLIDKDTKISRDIEIVVFRILQESLTNITRHAQADEVWISMKKKGNDLAMETSDNGIGISPEKITSISSFGLLNMKERAKEIGGSLSIGERPGGGTKIKLVIPNIFSTVN